MNIAKLEALVDEATSGSGASKVEATRMIDELRLDPERWSLGMKLFFDASRDMARLFGLSLVRDFIKSHSDSTHRNERVAIKDAILAWVSQTFRSAIIEPYIVNSIANIITLCVKCDFPEHWGSAFDDILSLSSLGRAGIDLATRVITDLDFEVVCFSESRTQDEISHNTRVKDAMREGNIIRNLVAFLCSTAMEVRDKGDVSGGDLGERCLHALAEMIGWIDISLVVNDTVLPQLYEFLHCEQLSSSACSCLLEIAKKGMDPVDKVKLLASICMVETLSRVPFSPQSSDGVEEDVGSVVDVIVLELVSCWGVFEAHALDMVHGNVDVSNDRQQQILEIGRITGEQLRAAFPVLMKVFNHRESYVAVTVVNSVKRLIAHVKKQQGRRAAPDARASEDILQLYSMYPEWFFLAGECLTDVLSGIYSQLQYPEDFYEAHAELSEEDDEEYAAELETKNQIRGLFVSCTRIRPTDCLELIAAVLSSQSQPLYSAPFPQLEAALRLVYSFAECGPSNTSFINEGMFPGILEALHQSNIHRHSNPLVLIAYYEVAARYAYLSPMNTILGVVGALVSPQGLRHNDPQLRSRSAYLLRKVAEALRDDAKCLIAAVGTFADLILTQTGHAPPLPEQAELHLLEAVGMMTSSGTQPTDSPQSPSNCNTDVSSVSIQLRLLEDMLSSLVRQLQDLTNEVDSNTRRGGEQLAEAAAWKFGSLAALARGHTPRTHNGSSADMFYQATLSVTPALREFGKYKPSRSKGIVFLHRMVLCVGPRVVESISKCIHIYFECADASDIEFPVQLINQLMVEFGDKYENVVMLVEDVFQIVINRLGGLYSDLLRASAEAAAASAAGKSAYEHRQEDTIVDTTLESDKLAIQKQYLVFVQHVAAHCNAALVSPNNVHRLPEIFSNIMTGLRGGDDDGIGVTVGLPLRRNAVSILSSLAKVWMASDSPVSPDVTGLVVSLLCDQALPVAIGACSDNSLNVSDPQTQGYIADVGILLWSMASVRRDDTISYVQSALLPSLGWHTNAISEVVRLFENSSQLNVFRDSFKKLIRELNNR
mmetsp:Transcript_24391/g.35819  ORF Transcript_24391/g.35819 Transcript_24391/m.35819 type:complete len:1055 (+) Transcript_24391:112-3276(+)